MHHDANAPSRAALTRRRFLFLAGAGASGLLAACQPSASSPAPGAAPTQAATPPAKPTSAPSQGAGQPTAAAPQAGAQPTAQAAPKLAQMTKVKSLRATAGWLYAPADVATRKGFFKDENIENEDISTGQGENAPALISGAGEFALISSTSAMKAAAQDQGVVIVGGVVNKYASNVVIKKDVIDAAGARADSPLDAKVKLLKDLKIATTGPGGGPDLLMRYLVRKGGMDPERDLTLTPIQGGPSAMLAALERGQIDGFCLSSPTSDTANQKFGTAYLFNMAEDPIPDLVDFMYISVAATQSYTDRNEALVTGYLRALGRGLSFIKQERDAFAVEMREILQGTDPETFEISLRGNYPIYMDNPLPTQRHFDLGKEFLTLSIQATGGDVAPAQRLTFDKAMVPRYAEAAVKSLG